MTISGGYADLFRVPKSITAPTRLGLERLMLLNNLKNQVEFRYFDIQSDGKRWTAWYYFVVDRNKMLEENLDAVTGIDTKGKK